MINKLSTGYNRIVRNIVYLGIIWCCVACSHPESAEAPLPSAPTHTTAVSKETPLFTTENPRKLRETAFIIAAQRQGISIGEAQVEKLQDLLCEMDPQQFDAQKSFFAITLNQMQELNRPRLPPHTKLKTLGPNSPELTPLFQAVRTDLCGGT